MMKRRASAALTAILAFAAAQAAYGQQPQDHLVAPGTHGHDSYWTRRGAPPDGSILTVTYHVPVGVAPGEFSGTQALAIDRAAATWNASGAFVQLGSSGPGADIAFSFSAPGGSFPGDPGGTPDSGHFILYDFFHGGTYPDGTTLHTIFPHSAFPLIPTISLDPAAPSALFGWHDGVAPAPADFLDMESYALHEFGHALGLGAGVGPGVVMDSGNLGAGATNRSLDATDIAALQLLYGTPEPTTFVLFGMGLLAVGATHRLRKRGAKT